MEKKKQKILMIEDDPFLRKLYRNKLTLAGLEVIEAINGEEGLNKVKTEKPSLVLLDIILPRKSGFDVLIELKGNEKTRDIPVIILSVLGQTQDIIKGMTLGAEDYLIKSNITISEVVTKVREYLKNKNS
ncbi:MAG TPA: response regulator [Candidatus Humimicrobiaceae bacterium]|nr:response regulator [Candidatus Humimicrobiaceae bacterium]